MKKGDSKKFNLMRYQGERACYLEKMGSPVKRKRPTPADYRYVCMDWTLWLLGLKPAKGMMYPKTARYTERYRVTIRRIK